MIDILDEQLRADDGCRPQSIPAFKMESLMFRHFILPRRTNQIRELVLASSLYLDIDYVMKSLSSALSLATFLPNLRSLVVNEDFDSCFLMENDTVSEFERKALLSSFRQFIEGMEELDLSDCSGADGLVQLLGPGLNLKRLSISVNVPKLGWIRAKRILEAVAQHNTLRELNLGYVEPYKDSSDLDYARASEPFDIFDHFNPTSFPLLTSLKVSNSSINLNILIRQFSPQLERLDIESYSFVSIPDAPLAFPRLKSLTMWGHPVFGILNAPLNFPSVSSLKWDFFHRYETGNVPKLTEFLDRFPVLACLNLDTQRLDAADTICIQRYLEEKNISLGERWKFKSFEDANVPLPMTEQEFNARDEIWAAEVEESLAFMTRRVGRMKTSGDFAGIRKLRPFFEGWDELQRLEKD